MALPGMAYVCLNRYTTAKAAAMAAKLCSTAAARACCVALSSSNDAGMPAAASSPACTRVIALRHVANGRARAREADERTARDTQAGTRGPPLAGLGRRGRDAAAATHAMDCSDAHTAATEPPSTRANAHAGHPCCWMSNSTPNFTPPGSDREVAAMAAAPALPMTWISSAGQDPLLDVIAGLARGFRRFDATGVAWLGFELARCRGLSPPRRPKVTQLKQHLTPAWSARWC